MGRRAAWRVFGVVSAGLGKKFCAGDGGEGHLGNALALRPVQLTAGNPRLDGNRST